MRTAFSEVQSVFGFCVRLQNPKSRFQNLNRTQPRVRFLRNLNPDNGFCVFCANPKPDHESIKSTFRVYSSDQIQIRFFEIHKLSVFSGEDLKKVFLTSGFPKVKWNTTDAVHVWHSNWTYVAGALTLSTREYSYFEPLVTYHSMFVIYLHS